MIMKKVTHQAVSNHTADSEEKNDSKIGNGECRVLLQETHVDTAHVIRPASVRVLDWHLSFHQRYQRFQIHFGQKDILLFCAASW